MPAPNFGVGNTIIGNTSPITAALERRRQAGMSAPGTGMLNQVSPSAPTGDSAQTPPQNVPQRQAPQPPSPEQMMAQRGGGQPQPQPQPQGIPDPRDMEAAMITEALIERLGNITGGR